MSSLPNEKFLTVSTAADSGESAPKFDVNTASKTTRLTQSSPPVLQPSLRELPTAGRVEKIYTRAIRQSPSEPAPTVPEDHSYENYAEQQGNQQLLEGATSCCNIIDIYTNFVTKVRNSVFIYMVLLLFYSIPASAIIMGVLFAENCPKLHFLPVFGAVVGAIGAIFMAVWVYVIFTYRRGTPCSNRQTFLFGMLCLVITVMTTLDAVFVFSLSPSSDPSSPEYCNDTFHDYAFYKEIATAVAIVLTLVLYLPGSRHILCCTNCSMRSPPNAFYASL